MKFETKKQAQEYYRDNINDLKYCGAIKTQYVDRQSGSFWVLSRHKTGCRCGMCPVLNHLNTFETN
jgi:hypothetical protein